MAASAYLPSLAARRWDLGQSGRSYHATAVTAMRRVAAAEITDQYIHAPVASAITTPRLLFRMAQPLKHTLRDCARNDRLEVDLTANFIDHFPMPPLLTIENNVINSIALVLAIKLEMPQR